MSKNKPWALIVDDHPMYSAGLKNALFKTYKFDKIEEAANGQAAVDLVRVNSKIDVIFMDIDMPIMNGVEASKLILEQKPQVKIIVTTMFSEPKYIKEMVKLDVCAYLLKDSTLGEITKALEMVLDNQHYYSPKIQALIIEAYKEIDKRKEPNALQEEITKGQKQVLELLCQQHSNTEIAKKMSISELTVKRHRQNLLERTNSKNLVGLIIYAIANDIYSITKPIK